MSLLDVRVDERETPDHAPARSRSLPVGDLVGVAAIAALLPLRGIWAADVLLVGLALTVPGFALLRALRVPNVAVTGYPVYVPVASLAVLMVSGLLADVVAPSVGIAHPLRGVTTAVVVLALTAVLSLAASRGASHDRLRWAELIPHPSLLLPLALPALSAAGALLLNNGHGHAVARAAAGAAVLALISCFAFTSRLSRGALAMLLFACALATEWAFSVRSQEIIGFDITTELYIAQHTHAAGVWHVVHHHDAYGAMLSITILPSVLAAVTGCSPLIAFKVLYPVLAALLPVSIFLVAERFLRRAFAVGAAALMLVQSYFFQQGPELARQEIALVFFAALIAAVIDGRMTRGARLRLVAVFALGVVVSHYSSTYLAISVLVIALALEAIVSRFRALPTVAAPMAVATAVLLGGAAIWYAGTTRSASNVSAFVSSLQRDGLELQPHGSGGIVNQYLNGNVGSSVTATAFERLAIRDYRSRQTYIHPIPAANQPRFQLQPDNVPVSAVRSRFAAAALTTVSTVFGQLMLVFGVVGAVVLTLRRGGGVSIRQVGILALAAVAMLAVVRFSGTAAAAYNQSRALLQALVLLAIPAAWLAQVLLARTRGLRWAAGAALVLTFAVVFAVQTGVVKAIVGGNTSLNLSQSGEDFERQYITPAELAAATWATVESFHQPLYADRYGQLRLFAARGAVALTDLVPQTLDGGAWVYATRTNTLLGRARGQIADTASTYRWPSDFLNSFFDTMYANGDSEVLHR